MSDSPNGNVLKMIPSNGSSKSSNDIIPENEDILLLTLEKESSNTYILRNNFVPFGLIHGR